MQSCRRAYIIAQMCGRGGKRSGLGAYSFAKRLVPVVAARVFDGSHPCKVERVLRHLEFAHRRATQLFFCQELRLVVLHERQQPVAASLPLLGKLVRELLPSALRHRSVTSRHAELTRQYRPGNMT